VGPNGGGVRQSQFEPPGDPKVNRRFVAIWLKANGKWAPPKTQTITFPILISDEQTPFDFAANWAKWHIF
jgi:hypothetical protein